MKHRETTFIRYTRAYSVKEVDNSQLGTFFAVSYSKTALADSIADSNLISGLSND